MKKIWALVFSFSFSFTLIFIVGCGVPNSEHLALKRDHDALKVELAKMQHENSNAATSANTLKGVERGVEKKPTFINKPVFATDAHSSRIPLGKSFVIGNPNAPITIVAFSDFQCPFCRRGSENITKILKKYPKDVKIVFKHFPLAFHKEAIPAAKAAIAAGNQGKFEEMHNLLFANQKDFRQKGELGMQDLLMGYANTLGLDLYRFASDLRVPMTEKLVKEDIVLGERLGVRSTPHFFINGERLSGSQPVEKFEEIIKRQIIEVKDLRSKGIEVSDLYKVMVDTHYEAYRPPPTPAKAKAAIVVYVPVNSKDPVNGNHKALVTIVAFLDFQCPFCTRVNPTLKKIKEKYGKQVRIVFKQNPLPFHKQAPEAAKAALAAHRQGKFLEMHDLLFENQKRFKTEDMTELSVEFAKKLKLNIKKFKKDLKSKKIKKGIAKDMALAQKVEARGTPNFFINGVNLVGAQPFSTFEVEIDKQLEIAKKIKKKKRLSGTKLYKAAVAYNIAQMPQTVAPKKPAAKINLKLLKIGKSAVLGKKKAKIMIYVFSSFECPYCKLGAATIKQVVKDYDHRVSIVFKSFPLPFHKHAEAASIAALAAKKQGKFWEMHDLLFKNQKRFKTEDMNELVISFAKKLGLNMIKFKKHLASPKILEQVRSEAEEGKKVGVRGTPEFFINGRRLQGAQPIEKFHKIIDEELKK